RLRDGEISLSLITLREFTMQRIMNIITYKPSWHTKKVVSKRKEESLNAKDLDVTQAMMDWCIEELLCKAQIFKKSGLITAYDSGVVKSDTAVPEELRQALLAAAKPLENVPIRTKTGTLRRTKKSSTLSTLLYSRLCMVNLLFFQTRLPAWMTVSLDVEKEKWRTCDSGVMQMWLRITVVDFSGFRDIDISDNQVKIKSYINNLHPQKYKDLYGIIEQSIELTIPLWNTTLSGLNSIDGQYPTRKPNLRKILTRKGRGRVKLLSRRIDIDKDDDQEVEDADHNSDWEAQDRTSAPSIPTKAE
ncbi:hypothetical protein APHAL10511_005134, partial [Amanita phalloides]